MREVDAVYGGEMSAHHYFRDFAYCDSGMIPWLLVLAVMSESGKSLSDLSASGNGCIRPAGDQSRTQPASGDTKAVFGRVQQHYQARAKSIDYTDGLSMEFERWRFNLRGSNTEPLVRLNVESRADAALMQDKTAEILRLLDARELPTPSRPCCRAVRYRHCSCAIPDPRRHRSISPSMPRLCGPGSWRSQALRFVLIHGAARARPSDCCAAHAAAARTGHTAGQARQSAPHAPDRTAGNRRGSALLRSTTRSPKSSSCCLPGAGVMNLLNAFHAQGYGAIWLTGGNAYDPQVAAALGFAAR